MTVRSDKGGEFRLRERVIEPPSGTARVDWGELWEYRELLAFLAWRDIKVRYRQTLLGFAWAMLIPLVQMGIFAFLFTRVAKVGTDGMPGPAFYLAALVPWNYFAGATALASNSLVSHAAFLTRIYVPRLVIPMVPCIAGLVDFGIAGSILLGMMAWYRIFPTTAVLGLPLLMAVAVLTTLGLGCLLSALNVRYRDVRHAVPFLLQVWMYLTVVVPFSALPESLGMWRYAFGLNPMVGVVEGFRWCLFHQRMDPESRWAEVLGVAVPSFLPLVALGLPVALVLLAAGIRCFLNMERTFADAV